MGLDFIRDTKKQFEQKRDKSKIEELDVADLLSRGKPDAIIPIFHCQLTDPSAVLEPGLHLAGRAYSETDLIVMQRGKKIGEMIQEDAAELTRLMKENHQYHGIVTLIIEQPAGIDGVFTVRSKQVLNTRS